jgi:hypothetical protein
MGGKIIATGGFYGPQPHSLIVKGAPGAYVMRLTTGAYSPTQVKKILIEP